MKNTTIAGFGFLGALDCIDLSQNIGEDDDWGKRLHLGAEVKFPLFLSLQAGLNQGYLAQVTIGWQSLGPA